MSNLSLNNKSTKRRNEYDNKRSRLEQLSYHVSTGIGKFFYRLGFWVAGNPKKTILLSWLSVLVCCLGFFNFYQERDPLKLWVPSNSKFLQNTQFIIKNFGEGVRTQNVLIVSKDNVLIPEVLQTLEVINREIDSIKAIGDEEKEVDFEEICFKIPIIASFTTNNDDRKKRRRKKRSTDFNDEFFSEDENSEAKKALKMIFEPFLNFDMKKYCSIIDSLPKGCMRENFLELWKSNHEKIKNLTNNEIISKLNQTDVNPESGHAANFVSLLGGVERDSDGLISSAKSVLSSWMLHINFSEVDSTKLGNIAGTEDWATYNTMVFEQKFIDTMQRLKSELDSDDITIYYAASRSFGDISSKTLFQDIDKLILGVVLMMIYMLLLLSKFSWTELRVTLTSIGLMNVGMAYISGCGISSVFFSYSPVHTSLFFIIMGLGVDDIFVIMSAFRKISDEYSNLTLSEKFGKTMEKAGASITITSLTDIIAFLVGGTTVLPSLRSFCIFAAMCILMTYLYVVTFFIAVFTLDEKRLARDRNGCCPCIVHKESKLWCNPKLTSRFITFLYSRFVLKKPGKFFIIVFAVILSAFSIERVFQIKQKFDPIWFIPSSTYYFKYAMMHRELYPNHGFEAAIYMGNLNYTEEIPKILKLSEKLNNQTDILGHVSSWIEVFQEFMEEFYKINVRRTKLTDEQFKIYISKFLFSASGGQYQANFRFDKTLVCGEPASDVRISSISFNFHKFEDRDEYLPAKRAVEEIIREANFTADQDKVFLWGKIFGNWITDEIIDEEIFRNISLALAGVFICTTLMIVNLQVCFYIFICVLLSLVSVGGFMQVWGLGLDLVTCISLQLSVGICIDCAAHIGHTFLTISCGDGNQRALQTVENIGAAVWQGGGSTMLAVALLAFSDAYTYQTFFKVFTIVVIFGLFYGTFLLPVILSIFIPKPYEMKKASQEATELCVIQKVDDSDFIEPDDKINCDNHEIAKLNGSKLEN